MILSKIKDLLASNQSSTDYLAFELLSSQLNWKMDRIIWFCLKEKCRQLISIQDITFHCPFVKVELLSDLPTLFGLDPDTRYVIHLELSTATKSLFEEEMILVEALDDSPKNTEAIRLFKYKTEIIRFIPEIISSIQLFLAEK